MTAPLLPMNDGRTIPQIGLGTWPLNDRQAETVVAEAVAIGYRHIDTAVRYGNETGVGRGIAGCGVPREQLFVTTKVDGEFQGADRAAGGIAGSLRRLGLDYVDLLLIHWPLPERDQYVSTWRTLERLRTEGLTRSIGVSNFKPSHLERLMAESSVVPAVNQIQVHPFVTRQDHRRFGADHGILTVSYSPLGRAGELLRHPLLEGVARSHGKTPAQIVLRWHVQQGLVPIPKSADPRRLSENLDVFGFSLTAEELAAIGGLDTGKGVDSDVQGH